MKKTKIIGLMLLVAMFTCFQAQAQETKKSDYTPRMAGYTNTGKTPGLDGARNIENFTKGDNSGLINKNSRADMRYAAAKESFRLCATNLISYENYCIDMEYLGKKAKPEWKVMKKRAKIEKKENKKIKK